MATCGGILFMALFAGLMFSLSLIHHRDAHNYTDMLKANQKALFDFFEAVNMSKDVDWKMNVSVCTWKGVTCDSTNSFVIWLRLPAKSILGQIPNNTIGNLTFLQVLSLRQNGFTGPIPSDFSKLKSLTHFSLNNNSFSGQLPNINVKYKFNVSDNNLSGCIPPSLSNFDNSSFSVNNTLDHCNFPVSTPELKPEKKFPTGAIVGIAVGLPLLLLVLHTCLRKDRNLQHHNKQTHIPQLLQTSSSKDDLMDGERNKLVFFEDGIFSFGLEDLLRASAEVLGKGRIGTTYKALMKEGAVVVVKRLKDVVLTKKEFQSQMEVLGNMKNENVVPLRAYYCSEDEKLLVYDYFPAGSVYDLLHGSRGSGQTPLDWDERMRIALSAARGLAYLHVAGKIVHGNFNSSNILLRQETNKEASVSDYGLNILFERSSSSTVTIKSDVYSFGVFLLELLTRKVPNQASLGDEGVDLPRWVQSVAREEWKTEVFDMELMRYQNVEEEMVQLLQIAMACASFVADQRPTMHEVVRKMEDMNRAQRFDV